MKTPIDIEIPKTLPQHPWHPSVVYVPEGWNGHRFWMAQTPYPPFQVAPYKDRWELPCIHYSNDGLHWKSIEANPIDDLTKEQIANKCYFSDTHLLLRDNRLECFYRFVEEPKKRTIIYKKVSLDGIHWKNEGEWRIESGDVISPAFIWTGKEYCCWYVDDTFTNLKRKIRYAKSVDGIAWTQGVECSLDRENIWPWHIDVQYCDGKYQLLVFDVDHQLLVMFQSEDGIRFVYQKELLRTSGRAFDFYNRSLYRACSVRVGEHNRVYFSASNTRQSYIGVLQTSLDFQATEILSPLHGCKKIQFVIGIIGQEIRYYSHAIRHGISMKVKALLGLKS